jgi:hypothetical protein
MIEVSREARSRARLAVLRTEALHAGGSTLVLAAVIAFIGWTVGEMIVALMVNILQREPG